MLMAVTVPRYTIKDLDSFPDDGNQYELLDGVLLVTPASAPLHQRVVTRLLGLLNDHLSPTGKAEALPGSVEIEPNLHLEPDVLVVPAGEFAKGLTVETRWTSIRSWWLAIEVSGKGSVVYDRDHKGPAYLAVGVREFWRVDLQEECIYLRRSSGQEEIRLAERVVWHPPELPEPLIISIPFLFGTPPEP
jgi:Uma2 family endonuclease